MDLLSAAPQALTLGPLRAAWTARFMAQEVSPSLLPVPIPVVRSPLPEQLLKPDYEGRNTAWVPSCWKRCLRIHLI